MQIHIDRYPTAQDWARCKALALNTIGKKYAGSKITPEWKLKILRAEHSPIRTLMFTIRMEDIPYYVSTHFRTHHVGAEHYVQSQRNDRQDNYDRRAARQDAPVTHIMDLNAQALMNIAHKRLCQEADPATQEVMREIVRKVEVVAPEIASMLTPSCEYYGGFCHELFSSCEYAPKD